MRAAGFVLTKRLPRFRCVIAGTEALSLGLQNNRNKTWSGVWECEAADQSRSCQNDNWMSSFRKFSVASSLGQSLVQQFRLAQTGEGIKECELVQWFVKEGDTVEEFGRVCEVHSDKATIEITSPYAGVVSKLYHSPGAVVEVGQVLADITASGKGGESTDAIGTQYASEAATAHSTQVKSEESSGANTEEGVATSPAVRRLAKELNINIANVVASGPQGRVTKADVLASAGRMGQAPAQASSIKSSERVPPPAMQPSFAGAEPPSPSSGSLESVVVPLRGYRRAMVRSMTVASQIPHFHFCDEVEMDRLAELRNRVKDSPMLNGMKLTYMPFIIKAAAVALQKFPTINSSLALDGQSLLQHGRINIGIAVATPHGLAVPNIKDVQRKSIAIIAEELRKLQLAAMENQLKTEDLTGGTFTISNIGTVGGTYATPLVNSPEVAIMALGKIRKVPRLGPDDRSIIPANVVSVSLGADHRVVDGATLGHFACAWKDLMENPGLMLMELQ